MIKSHPLFEGVSWADDKLATKALVPGKVYGEHIIGDYRIWNPWKSKPAAAILNGLRLFPIKPGQKVLYLGAGTGTTSSHFSDIVGPKGAIFCVEFASRTMQKLMNVCLKRKNMVPFLADANRPQGYAQIGKVDVLYQDVAQADQAGIFIKNLHFLKDGGFAMLMVKSRSVDVTKAPKAIYEQVSAKLQPHLIILEIVELGPYEKDHAAFLCQKPKAD